MVQKLIVTILIICIYVIIYWKEIKLIKNKKVKDTLQILLGILFVPALILLLDIWNSFEVLIPNVYDSITEKYDMLSFLGAYLSAIVSSVLLIIITDKDRKENTRILRESQRPYLSIILTNVNVRGEGKYYYGDFKNKNVNKALCLKIKNVGESVAIIDVNSIKIKAEYPIHNQSYYSNYKEIEVSGKNSTIPIGKNETIYICFLYEEFYKNNELESEAFINYCNIKYKDLFKYEYIVRTELVNGSQKILIDNQPLKEDE